MTCPKCGAHLPTDARFCSVCGSNLSATASSPTANVGPTPPSGHVGAGGIRIDSDGRGSGRGYSYEVLYQGAFALATVKLQAEQSINAEAGAMVAMSGNVELYSQMKSGFMGALKRVVGGETAFVSTFTARGGPGEVSFAPGSPGDIAAIEMKGQVFFVQSSSYLAGDTSLTVDTRWGGARSFFGGEGLFVLQIQGSGLLLVSSFGSIHRKRLNYGEPQPRGLRRHAQTVLPDTERRRRGSGQYFG